jgi:PAS domain S-box-containing protein
MKYEPEIIRLLREEERLGKLQSRVQNHYEELETEDKQSSDASDESICFPENINKFRERNEEYEGNNYPEIDTSESFHELLFQITTDIMFYLDKTGRIIRASKAGLDFVGFTEREVIGKLFWKLPGFLPKSDLRDYIKAFKSVLKGKETEKIIGKLNDKNGKIRLVEFSIHLTKDNKTKYILVIGRDITDREQTEEERQRNAEYLKKMNEQLKITQKELSALNEELEQKVEERTSEIETLLKHKDDFIAQLGHDLKSPLTPLIGLLPMVEEEEQDPKLKELLQVSIRNVKYMRDLVVKTLQLERLNSPNTVFNLEDINFIEAVNNILDTKKLIFEENNLTIENKIDKKITIQGDSLQLNELFDNLLTNAVKFTPKGGSIAIDAKKDKDTVTVSVTDTGIGMTKEQIDLVFEEFYKVDSARHDLESSGLGLSISKRIVDKHGGKIWAESPGSGKGTTFYFILPLDSKKEYDIEKIKRGREDEKEDHGGR